MSILVEAYHVQHRRTILHLEKLFYYKIVLLIVLASSFAWGDILVFIVLSAIIATHLFIARAFKLIILSILIYLPPASIILLIDFFAGTLTIRVIRLLLFGYMSFIGIILFYATTPIQQLYDKLGRNPLTLALLMLHNVVAELNNVIESKRARGWEPGWNIYRHFIIVFEAIRILGVRIEEISIALRSRGIE